MPVLHSVLGCVCLLALVVWWRIFDESWLKETGDGYFDTHAYLADEDNFVGTADLYTMDLCIVVGVGAFVDTRDGCVFNLEGNGRVCRFALDENRDPVSACIEPRRSG